MADIDETLQEVNGFVERARGFISDAEFREEVETKQIRYMQATSDLLLAVTFQNGLIIELLKAQSE